MASITIYKSNGEKAGEFPKMFWEMLQYLEHQKRPLYKGSKEKLNDRMEWHVQVLIYTPKPNRDGVFKVALTIGASGRRSTFYAGIRDAACQAMYRVRDNCAHQLSNTRYRYFPRRRVCNTEKNICYNKHQINHSPELIQQIRLTKALVAVCDDTSDELRETRCKVRELEEELEALRGHKAIVVAAPPPHPLLVANGNSIHNEGVSFGGSCAITQAQAQAQAQAQGDRPPGTVTAPAPPERTRSSAVVVGNRRATCSTKLAPTRRAPAPCGRRRLARGGIANESSVSCGAGGSSIISGAGAIPQGQGHRPPSTQKSFFMHPAVAVEAPAPRRDRTPAASSAYERRRHGSNLMPIIADGGAALGKEPANANNPGDATASAFRSSARQRSLLQCNAEQS